MPPRSVSGPLVLRLRVLKNISWLTKRQSERLAQALRVSEIEKDGTIFAANESPECMHILVAGRARITCLDRKGQRKSVLIVAPGIIPGFPSPPPGIVSDFRCEAITPCQTGTIEFESFIKMIVGIDSVGFRQVASAYYGRWDLVQLRSANFMSCTLEERLALILLELSEDFGVHNRKGVRLTVRARHSDLAELVGASRPRVTEHLALFEQKHLISREDRQLVVDCDRLKSLLAQASVSANGR